MTHNLKAWPVYFSAINSGSKTFEIRKDDRGFKVGDTLRLQEYSISTKQYTGRECARIVTYILQAKDHPGIADGYVIMGLKAMPAAGFTQAPSVQTVAGIMNALAKNGGKEPQEGRFYRRRLKAQNMHFDQ